ncbi:hypothetical protein [Prescottella agglutinans]|uniref:Uncharacterized protein n=1 Tax=Prescottella agglutinans TaxID=1644129 RepID=A0ABT6MGA8_9NOCA|nr:hypothetical protein [Prescottella agglutinans]MDH6282914.1 hypothetical protein [Prescottella agglutinans]
MVKPLGNTDIVEFIPDELGLREREGEFFVLDVINGEASLIASGQGCLAGPKVPVEKLRRVHETFGEFTRETFVDEESVMSEESDHDFYA